MATSKKTSSAPSVETFSVLILGYVEGRSGEKLPVLHPFGPALPNRERAVSMVETAKHMRGGRAFCLVVDAKGRPVVDLCDAQALRHLSA